LQTFKFSPSVIRSSVISRHQEKLITFMIALSGLA
jgi:hypothetical protein